MKHKNFNLFLLTKIKENYLPTNALRKIEICLQNLKLLRNNLSSTYF